MQPDRSGAACRFRARCCPSTSSLAPRIEPLRIDADHATDLDHLHAIVGGALDVVDHTGSQLVHDGLWRGPTFALRSLTVPLGRVRAPNSQRELALRFIFNTCSAKHELELPARGLNRFVECGLKLAPAPWLIDTRKELCDLDDTHGDRATQLFADATGRSGRPRKSSIARAAFGSLRRRTSEHSSTSFSGAATSNASSSAAAGRGEVATRSQSHSIHGAT